MKDLKLRLLENPDENICVGFGTDRKVEQMSKSVNLLLFADDTTSLCRKSNMQNRKEMLKQAFKDWKLILNDDKWEHIIAENDPEERKRQRKKMDKTARILGAHRNALGTFHHDQKKRLMAARKAWFKLSQKLPSWALSKKLERQIATAVVGATLLFGCEVRGFSSKDEREYEALWSRVVFGITRQKRGQLEQDKKTLADLRIMCRMKPILDLIRIRQLNYLASLARLPDDRLEKIVLRGHLIPEHAVGTSKEAPKNTVRNQYKKQLLSVVHLAPEELRATWLRDWEKIAVDVVGWKKFMRKVYKWQDAQEEEKRYSNIHDHNARHQEIIMTRKAAVDSLRLEFTGGKAKCPLCQMEYGRSGMAVHFARCNQMNEEQRRFKTAARIREIGGRKTDLSVELNVPKKQVKQVTQEAQQSKEEGMDVVELQKKFENMVKKVKDEQAKWKEEKFSAQPPPHPFFQEEMDSRGIKMRVAGNIAFRGRFQSWLQDEYRYSNRAPPQHWVDRASKGENCSTCAKCPSCRIGLCMGARWEKDFEGCSKYIHCNKCVASGNHEDWKKFQAQAQLCNNTPRAPVENIKELPAAELAEGLPKNQCPWCGLTQQSSTSVHRKFCMKIYTYVVGKTESFK